MDKIEIVVYLLPLLLILFLWMLRYPSKAVYLLAFSIPLSPYIALSESAYAARGAFLLNISDLLVAGLFLSVYFSSCINGTSHRRYPLLTSNIAVLLLYLALLVCTLITRPMNEFLFQMIYFFRYSLYIMTGFYVWRYLPVHDIEKYVVILLVALLANSIYGIYYFFDVIYKGASFAGMRANGFWSMIIGLDLEAGVGDPANFAMYIAMTLIISLFYISYVKPAGAKKTLALTSLFFGFITLHMTLSRSEIVAFWGISLYLVVFMKRDNLKLIMAAFFLLAVIAGAALVSYIGSDIVGGISSRIYGTFGEFTVREGRFNQVYELSSYLLDRIEHWWGHGISSWRLYKDEFLRAGITEYASGSLYSGYATILWDAGIIGIAVWLVWVKKHFLVIGSLRRKQTYWMAMVLKAILICFFISMIATSVPLHNFRLMGYFSFLAGLFLKFAHQHRVPPDQVRDAACAA